MRFCQKECPLYELCEDRLEVADFVLSRLIELQRTTLEDSADKLTDDQSTHLERLHRVAAHLQGALAFYLSDMSLIMEMQTEHITQTAEALKCPGPILKRSHGLIGRIVSRDCGSQDRKDRLRNHMHRREPPDSSSLPAPAGPG